MYDEDRYTKNYGKKKIEICQPTKQLQQITENKEKRKKRLVKSQDILHSHTQNIKCPSSNTKTCHCN